MQFGMVEVIRRQQYGLMTVAENNAFHLSFFVNHIFTGSKDEMFAMNVWGLIAEWGHQDDDGQIEIEQKMKCLQYMLIWDIDGHQDDGNIEEEQQLWQLRLRFILFVKRAVFRKYTGIRQIHTRVWKTVVDLNWPICSSIPQYN